MTSLDLIDLKSSRVVIGLVPLNLDIDESTVIEPAGPPARASTTDAQEIR